MKCPKCGHDVVAGSKFCEYCGTPVPQEKRCPACGAVVGEGEKFCHSCGKSLYPQQVQTVEHPQTNRTPLYIVGGIAVVLVAIGIGFGIASYSQKPVKEAAPATKQITPVKDETPSSTKITEIPKEVPNPQAADTQAPVAVFKSFHENITNHRYQAAYNALSPTFQQEMPYDGWAQGYGMTISSEPTHIQVTSKSDTQVELQYDLTAKDRDAGRVKIQYFRGTASMIKDGNTWKIDSIAATKMGEEIR